MVQIQDNDGAISIDTGDREPLKLWIDDVVSQVFILGRHALHCCSHLGFKGIGAGICERLHHNIFLQLALTVNQPYQGQKQLLSWVVF